MATKKRGPDKKPRKRGRAATSGSFSSASPSAGRPRGTSNALPQGAVGAIRALRYRVPDDAPQELADAAGEALEAVVEIMKGDKVRQVSAHDRLSAARTVREEVCGPITQKVEVSGDLARRIVGARKQTKRRGSNGGK